MKGLFLARGLSSGKGSMLSCFGLSMITRSSLIPKKSMNAMFAARGGGNAGRAVRWALEGGGSRSGTSHGGQDRRTPLNLSR